MYDKKDPINPMILRRAMRIAQNSAYSRIGSQRPQYGLNSRQINTAAIVGGVAAAAGAARKAYNYFRPSASVSSNAGSSRKVVGKPQKKKKPRKCKSQMKCLKEDVKELKSKVNNTVSNFKYRVINTGRVLSSVNQCNTSLIAGSSTTSCETALAQLRFLDPSTPGTLITGNLSSPTFAQNIDFVSQYAKLTFVNNYQVPVHIQVNAVVPKSDTSIAPNTAFTNGLADNAGGALTATDINVYFSDSHQFRQIWKVDESGKAFLQPGETFTFVYKTKGFTYDPSLIDSHNLTYQRSIKSFAFMMRIVGVLGHDTSQDEQGILAAGVDYLLERVWHIRYDAGIELDYVVNSNTLDTFTNGGLISSKPVADNIGYSVS